MPTTRAIERINVKITSWIDSLTNTVGSYAPWICKSGGKLSFSSANFFSSKSETSRALAPEAR